MSRWGTEKSRTVRKVPIGWKKLQVLEIEFAKCRVNAIRIYCGTFSTRSSEIIRLGCQEINTKLAKLGTGMWKDEWTAADRKRSRPKQINAKRAGDESQGGKANG